MLKKMFRKNGLILINQNDTNTIDYNYFIINHYNISSTNLDHLKLEYYKSLNFIY